MLKIDHPLTPEILAIRFNRPPGLIDDWVKGVSKPPPYIDKAMSAIKRNLKPADNITMRKPRDLCEFIGAPRETVPYWLATGQFPLIARYAVAFEMTRITGDGTPTANEIEYIRKVYSGYYRKLGIWYVSKPVIGKCRPRIKCVTLERLIAHGWLKTDRYGNLIITQKAREKYIDRA